MSATVLPEILKSFRSKYPGIQIQLRAGEYGEISEDLRKGSLDCGFLGEDEAAGFYSRSVGAVPIPGSGPENTLYGRMIRFSVKRDEAE